MEKIEAGKPLSVDQVDYLRRERLALSRLTDKQKLFCETYVQTFDKVLSLKAAGYSLPKTKGGSQAKLIEKNFEGVMASEAVQEYIALLKQSVASRLGVSMDEIVDQYRIMAFASMDDYVEWDKKGLTVIKSSKQLTKAQKAGICEITETTTKLGKTVKIKLYNKQSALDRLFDILKELEVHETREKGPATISIDKVLVMLQDPTKRRALEHISEGMFSRPIKLIGTDRNKEEFNKHLDIITKKLEAASGISGRRDAERPAIPQGEKDSGETGDRGSDKDKNTKEENVWAEAGLHPKDGDGRTDEDGSEEGNRYPVDGL